MENTNRKKFPYLLTLIKFETLVGPLNQFDSYKNVFHIYLYIYQWEKMVADGIREQSENMAHPNPN